MEDSNLVFNCQNIFLSLYFNSLAMILKHNYNKSANNETIFQRKYEQRNIVAQK